MRSVAAIVLAAVLCSGCALTTAKIDVPYQPATAAAQPVPGASDATVDVSATDARTTYRDRVGTKKNGYRMEMAAIVAGDDVPDSVRDAFRQELAERGFKMGAGPAMVQIQLVRFYNDFKPGLFSGSAVANVAFNVKVAAQGKSAGFSKYYEGTGTESNIMMFGGDNARAALMKAFQASVASAMSDPDFIAAIEKDGGSPPQPAKPAA